MSSTHASTKRNPSNPNVEALLYGIITSCLDCALVWNEFWFPQNHRAIEKLMENYRRTCAWFVGGRWIFKAHNPSADHKQDDGFSTCIMWESFVWRLKGTVLTETSASRVYNTFSTILSCDESYASISETSLGCSGQRPASSIMASLERRL